MQIMTMD